LVVPSVPLHPFPRLNLNPRLIALTENSPSHPHEQDKKRRTKGTDEQVDEQNPDPHLFPLHMVNPTGQSHTSIVYKKIKMTSLARHLKIIYLLLRSKPT